MRARSWRAPVSPPARRSSACMSFSSASRHGWRALPWRRDSCSGAELACFGAASAGIRRVRCRVLRRQRLRAGARALPECRPRIQRAHGLHGLVPGRARRARPRRSNSGSACCWCWAPASARFVLLLSRFGAARAPLPGPRAVDAVPLALIASYVLLILTAPIPPFGASARVPLQLVHAARTQRSPCGPLPRWSDHSHRAQSPLGRATMACLVLLVVLALPLVWSAEHALAAPKMSWGARFASADGGAGPAADRPPSCASIRARGRSSRCKGSA